MTIDYQALEGELRGLLPGNQTAVDLGYNRHAANQCEPQDEYSSYQWATELEADQAFETNRVWTVDLYGPGNKTESLAAPSLASLIGWLLTSGNATATMDFAALDDELRRILPNTRIGINLGYNLHAIDREDPYDRYENYKWAGDEDTDLAIEGESVWTIELYGHGIQPSVMLAASSLDCLMRLLKGSRDVILANQKREPSKRMSNRYIADMLWRSKRPQTFGVEKVVRRAGHKPRLEVVRRRPEDPND